MESCGTEALAKSLLNKYSDRRTGFSIFCADVLKLGR